jgi:hypothetical protein
VPEALPPWQTLVRVPKSPAALAPEDEDADDDDDDDDDELELVLDDPARLQPAASSAVAATAAATLSAALTGVLLGECAPVNTTP